MRRPTRQFRVSRPRSNSVRIRHQTSHLLSVPELTVDSRSRLKPITRPSPTLIRGKRPIAIYVRPSSGGPNSSLHSMSLPVVITDLQMLGEIVLGVGQAVLGLRSNHAIQGTETRATDCAQLAQTVTPRKTPPEAVFRGHGLVLMSDGNVAPSNAARIAARRHTRSVNWSHGESLSSHIRRGTKRQSRARP